MGNVRVRSGIEPALRRDRTAAKVQPARWQSVLALGIAPLLTAPMIACSVYEEDPWSGNQGDVSNRPVDAGRDGGRGPADAFLDERRADGDDTSQRDGPGISDASRRDTDAGATGGASGAAGGASGTGGAGGTGGGSGTGGASGSAGSSGAGASGGTAAGAAGAGGIDAGVADMGADLGSGTPDGAADRSGGDGGCTGATAPHDEDGDGIDDACDNCPSIANSNQADQGEIGAGLVADGVGDACDPRPSLAGESILLFDPLTSGQLGAMWSVYAGTWVPAADTVAETAVGMSQEIDRTDLTTQANYLAETRFRFDSLPDQDSRMTLPFRVDTTTHNGWGCAVTNRSLLALSTIVNGAAGETAPPTTPIPAPQLGTRYRVLAGAHGSNIYCLLPDTGQRITRSNTASPLGTPGLRTHLAGATFEYILVYRLGGALP